MTINYNLYIDKYLIERSMDDLIAQNSMHFPFLSVVLSAVPASAFFYFAIKTALKMKECEELHDVCED